jgi:site-specific recombinase XerC
LFPRRTHQLTAHLHPAVRPHAARVAAGRRPGLARLRHPLDATNEGTLINRKTKNLRAVQLLLGHSDIASTVRFLGIEVDNALEISEQLEI